MPNSSVSALSELLDRARNGEAAAVTEVLAIARARVLPYCNSKLTTWHARIATAEDTTQEVCVAIVRALPSDHYKWDGHSFWPLVFGITTNKVADVRRRAGRDRTDLIDQQAEGVDWDVTANPEAHALRRESLEQLGTLLATLTEDTRLILWLRLGLGWSAEQVASQIGTTAGSVRVRQYRALGQLRQRLAEVDEPARLAV